MARRKPIRPGDRVRVTMIHSGDLGTHPDDGRVGTVQVIYPAEAAMRRRAWVQLDGKRRGQTIAIDLLERLED